MLSNCGVREDFRESLGLQGDPIRGILKENNPDCPLEGHLWSPPLPKGTLFAFRNNYFFFPHSYLDLISIYSSATPAGVGTPNYSSDRSMRKTKKISTTTPSPFPLVIDITELYLFIFLLPVTHGLCGCVTTSPNYARDIFSPSACFAAVGFAEGCKQTLIFYHLQVNTKGKSIIYARSSSNDAHELPWPSFSLNESLDASIQNNPAFQNIISRGSCAVQWPFDTLIKEGWWKMPQ